MSVKHNIPPVYDKNSRVLILGSFPSVKSREAEFFYAHPQNRFWMVLSRVLECELPVTSEQKRRLLLDNRIAVWDVIASCEIKGSGDASIKNASANDISLILNSCDIQAIFCNGTKSYELYNRFILGKTDRKAQKLPSTSPANAAFGLDRLYDSWRAIKEYL